MAQYWWGCDNKKRLLFDEFFALKFGLDQSALDPLPTATTGRLPVAQFVAGQEPFVAFGNVPLPDRQTTEMPVQYQSVNPPNLNVPGRWQRFTKRAFQSLWQICIAAPGSLQIIDWSPAFLSLGRVSFYVFNLRLTAGK